MRRRKHAVPVARALALVVLCGSAAARADRGADAGSVLDALGPGASAEEIEARAAELAALPDAVTALLAVRATGRVPGTPGAELTPERARALARAEALLDGRDVVRAIVGHLSAHPEAAWRRAALDLLAPHAMAEDVALLARLARGEGSAPDVASAPLASFEDALLQTLRRDARALAELGRVHESLHTEVLRAVGRSGLSEGLSWLAQRLAEPRLVDTALQELARLARSAPAPSGSRIAEKLRPFLRAAQPSRRRHALQALVALGDSSAVPDLVRLLDSQERGERAAACAALRSLTGRALPERASTWQSWLEVEERWLRERSATVRRQLRSERDALVVAAVREISEHGLRRDEHAAALVPLLERHSSPVVRGQICLALARLGSRVPLDALDAALGDPDETVASHAAYALRALTGHPRAPEGDGEVSLD